MPLGKCSCKSSQQIPNNQAIHNAGEEGGTCTRPSFITLFQSSTGLFLCILMGFQLNCYFKYISSKTIWEIQPIKSSSMKQKTAC